MCGYKYTVCNMKKGIISKKKYSLHNSTSFPSPLTHTHFLFISLLNKKHIEEGKKKREKVVVM